MMVERTIAILGDTGEFPQVLMEAFAKQNLRLLYVSENEEKNVAVQQQLENLKVLAEVEFLSCEREGCWEADIIAFSKPESISPALVEKIKEVATQKIVVVVTGQNQSANFDALFPNSKVVEVSVNTTKEISISGKDKTANAEVQELIESTTYKSNK
ncbi:MAG: hypothetical protein ABJ092_14530 [Gillisia sp.]